MKFFKHFVDGHDSTAMTKVIEEFGLIGYAAYFIIMELGIAKIDKIRDQELGLSDCKFTLHERILRQKLRMKPSTVDHFLTVCQSVGLLTVFKDHQQFNFEVPKVLEFFDRDAKRARQERAAGAPKKEDKDKDKERDKPAAKKAEVVHLHPGLIQNALLERAEEIQAASEIISEIFQSRVPPRLSNKTAVAKLLLAFRGVSNLHVYLESVINEKPARLENPSWRTYVEARILKQLTEVSA